MESRGFRYCLRQNYQAQSAPENIQRDVIDFGFSDAKHDAKILAQKSLNDAMNI